MKRFIAIDPDPLNNIERIVISNKLIVTNIFS